MIILIEHIQLFFFVANKRVSTVIIDFYEPRDATVYLYL
jgi:hypothetical protein